MLPEFFEVMQRGISKIWSNDVAIAPTAEVARKEKAPVKKADAPVVSDGAETEEAKKKKVVAPTDDVSDMEYFKSRIKENLSDSESDSEADSDDDEDEDEADAGGHDADVRVFPIDGDDEAGGLDKDDDDDDDAMEVEADGKVAQESKADSDDVLDTGRLFVRNLPYTSTYWIVLLLILFILLLFILYISDCCQ